MGLKGRYSEPTDTLTIVELQALQVLSVSFLLCGLKCSLPE
jgi:hypothetical protein